MYFPIVLVFDSFYPLDLLPLVPQDSLLVEHHIVRETLRTVEFAVTSMGPENTVAFALQRGHIQDNQLHIQGTQRQLCFYKMNTQFLKDQNGGKRRRKKNTRKKTNTSIQEIVKKRTAVDRTKR